VVTVKVTHCVSGTWAVLKNTTTKPPRPRRSGQPWALWQRLAQVRTDFGNPDARGVTFLTGAFVRDTGFAPSPGPHHGPVSTRNAAARQPRSFSRRRNLKAAMLWLAQAGPAGTQRIRVEALESFGDRQRSRARDRRAA
jgi:hypothetical protein